MLNRLHNILVTLCIYTLLFPIYIVNGNKKCPLKENIDYILNNPIDTINTRKDKKIVYIIEKILVCIAVCLHRTNSFAATVKHIFSVARNGGAFNIPRTAENRQKNPQDDPQEELQKELQTYRQYCLSLVEQYKSFQKSEDFVPLAKEPMTETSSIKPVAFYLPQFYETPLNNEWFGKGFTEWSNVTKAIPLYAGHNQPQLPIDVGFYNLETIKPMQRQIELARLYGIHGFCFYYYWFSGTRLLDVPVSNWLRHRKELDFPFCLMWANENWTKLWDGGNREVRYRQELKPGDDERFCKDILPFFLDDRYIRIDNKPLFMIYRVTLFPLERIQAFIRTLRKAARMAGFDDVFLLATNFGHFDKPADYDCDGIIEFPPHGMKNLRQVNDIEFITSDFTGSVYDIRSYINNKDYLYSSEARTFKTVFPSWDNTPRKACSGCSLFEYMTPELYKSWLKGCIDFTREHHREEEQYIFINAWNEWAEGAHLEPDMRYGYAYLQATREALEESR